MLMYAAVTTAPARTLDFEPELMRREALTPLQQPLLRFLPCFLHCHQSDHTTSPVHNQGNVDNGVNDRILMDHREQRDSSAYEADGRDELDGRGQGRAERLDPLWEGLGSLGERLAEVGGRFDLLDREICHDREVSATHEFSSFGASSWKISRSWKRFAALSSVGKGGL